MPRAWTLVAGWTLASCAGTAAQAATQDTAPVAEQASDPQAEVPTLRVNGVLNGGFEWVADSTTDPPKYGAYWLGAFAPAPGDARCLVVEGHAFRGARCLRLSAGAPDVLQAGAPDVLQKVVADPRWTARITVSLALRTRGAGVLQLTLEDGPGRRTSVHLRTGPDGLHVSDEAGTPVTPLQVREGGQGTADQPPWWRLELDLGARFSAQHGGAPVPRLNLRLACAGEPEGSVDVDEVCVAVPWPAVDSEQLGRQIEALVLWNLDTWYLPADQGGLQLVDPLTGYVTVASYDVQTGGGRQPAPTAGMRTVHALLIEWLRECHRRGRTEQVDRWTPELERITRTLLEHHFHPGTGLPRLVSRATLKPLDDVAAPVGAYVNFLMDARELLTDEDLRSRCLAQARRIADTLIALQREHDLPPDEAPPIPQWNSRTGRFDGDTRNWFGFIPDRLTATGQIETDKRFFASWAILSGRTFWYELLRSPCAIMRVSEVAPRPGDLDALHRVLGRFHRDWDASRYDLENDTDDHYGHVCKDVLALLQHSGGKLPDALALVQTATDHRLARDAAGAGDTLWVQAVRLGTACAGDSSRALLDLADLYALPPEVNPHTSGLPLYRDALLELAQNDLKGRQVTNGQFSDSFFKNWEMVCICYRGTYQGDCREHPPEYWHGDVGDTFGGPPMSGVDAQTAAYRVADAARRQQILAGLAVMSHVTDEALRRGFGYLFGLDSAIARQYELPEQYATGLTAQSLAGLGYTTSWMRLLPSLDVQPVPHAPQLAWAESATLGRCLLLRAPAGSEVALPCSSQPIAAPISETDGRVLAFDLAELPGGLAGALRVTVGPEGLVEVPVARLPCTTGRVQPVLLDAASGEPWVVGEAVSLDG